MSEATLSSPPCSLPETGSMHSALIEQAAKWLSRKGCSIVITDMTHGGPETADAIGWRQNHATVIECKASRADFHADKHKVFRRLPDMGMGSTRYYCSPIGLLKAADLPEHWGLLEFAGGKLRETIKPTPHGCAANRSEEVRLLISTIRRIAHTPPKGVSVKCYTIESKCRATLGVSNEESTKVSEPKALEH